MYIIALISISYPINYYIKNEYGSRDLAKTIFLSSIWFLIPFIVFGLLLLDIKKAIHAVRDQEDDNDL
jgi:hypothetical protein